MIMNPKDQARNFENLCRGNSAYDIERALKTIRKDVLEVLLAKHGAADIKILAIKMAFS